MQTFFNEELNRPFAVGDLPIRFCVLPADDIKETGERSHYLAAVYDHWDCRTRWAMRELMQRIFPALHQTGNAMGSLHTRP